MIKKYWRLGVGWAIIISLALCLDIIFFAWLDYKPSTSPPAIAAPTLLYRGLS